MRIKCWKCKGKKRLRRQADLMLDVVTLGLSWLVDTLADKNDDRFWEDCDVCDGHGYQEDRR